MELGRSSRLFMLIIAIAATRTAVAQDGQQPETPKEAHSFEGLGPDMILVNGRVWTGVKKSEEPGGPTALAITGDRITAVGGDEQVRTLAGERTRIIDVGQRRVIPGITDSHTHLISMGLQLARLDLRSAGSKDEFVNMVAAAASRLPPGKWLLGGRFSVESWQKPESPRREWIDPVTPGTPVFLSRMDGHQALANSVALRFARIDHDGPPDPAGGQIERDPATGEPTGILKDAAMDLVSRHIPPPSKSEMYDALMAAGRVLNAWGITAACDMSDLDQLEIFDAARKQNALRVRIRSFVQSKDFKRDWPRLEPYVNGANGSSGWWQIGGFKAYMDGSLGSRTAYMQEPYEDATADSPYPRGLRSSEAADLDAFAKQLRWAHDKHMQLAVHAIGDQAIHELLDIYATLPDVNGRKHRVEHTQHLLPSDIARFARLGVIASMQPLHKADDGRYAEKIIGSRRAETSYAFRSLIKSGATVCFGSDCPVVSANPFNGIAAAVSARTLDGKVWVPEQSITRTDALRCYTQAGAFAAFREDRTGTLEAGKLADIAVLNKDMMTVPVERMGEIESVLTIVGGRVALDRIGTSPTKK